MASRRRAFIASMKPCRRVNTGAVPRMATSEMESVTSVTASSTQPMTKSVENASPTEMAHMMGTGRIMSTVMSSVCCTTLASDSVRVIIDPVPKRLKSAAEKASEAR